MKRKDLEIFCQHWDKFNPNSKLTFNIETKFGREFNLYTLMINLGDERIYCTQSHNRISVKKRMVENELITTAINDIMFRGITGIRQDFVVWNNI